MKRHFTTLIVVAICSLLSLEMRAQIRDSSLNMCEIEVNYSLHFPGGDMRDRFGLSSTIGLGVSFKAAKNWILGIEYDYLFGGKVKPADTLLRALTTHSGHIINEYGEYATVNMYERGFYAGGNIGYLFPLGYNKSSGIVVNIGAGLLQHHIRIENKDNNAPPVIKEYKKGYDRLTNGLALKQFVGYQHLSNKRLINFHIGIEFYEAWTQCRRDYNFDTMSKDTQKRHDLLMGFRVGWIIPLYKHTPDDYYYQ